LTGIYYYIIYAWYRSHTKLLLLTELHSSYKYIWGKTGSGKNSTHYLSWKIWTYDCTQENQVH